MPLPDKTPLSLQVNANAGPKHAMIVRMSEETLDALGAFPNHPKMAFDFGDNPGIHIGDTFFPIRPLKEASPHELYLRASSAAKPMAPLKLYANVIGKFIVERQLGDKVSHKVRHQTMVAKQQHLERQAILLDQPPIPGPSAKNAKRKLPGSGTVIKKTPPSDHLRPAAAAAPARKPSPLPNKTVNPDVRRRLVHCLAMSPRFADDAVKMVGGANVSASARDDLLALLDDVAEQQAPARKGDKSPRPWGLKPQTWTEVRPFEWPKLTEPERVAMARQARLAFKALKIPESDPAWDNVRYRQTASSAPAAPPMASTSSARSSASTQADTKRTGITTKEAKLKAKQDSSRVKGEIQMKDESSKATIARVNAIKRADVDRSSASTSSDSKTVASRRLPGSGYQAKKSPQSSTAITEKSGSPALKPSLPPSLPQKPPPAVASTGGSHTKKAIPPKPTKREDESDRERDREYERERERERERREREREKEKQREEWERERVEMEKREKAKQKEREAMEREKRQREKEREREEMEQEKRRREKERTAKERAASGAVPAVKRKAVTQESEELLDDASSKISVPKRRKLDDGSSVPFPPRDAGPSGSKKPTQDPRLKMKKDPSPQAPASSQERRGTTSAGGMTHKSERASKLSGGIKSRRRSPIYTSSEDEGEIPQPRKRNPSPLPVSDRSNSSDHQPVEKAPRHQRATRTGYPPATDHAALRALYQSQYSDYLGTFSKIVAQKRKIEAMLNGDSEGEMDVMEPDDLVKLSAEHQSLKTELEHIHDIYTKGRSMD